ncbi:cytochrome c oxidase subunit 5b-1, mitochondrial-like [Carex rostrata]
MWRRLACQLRPIAATRSASGGTLLVRPAIASVPALSFSSLAGEIKKSVEDVMPIATGLEREEIEAGLQGWKRFDVEAPSGPFGTKEGPAIIQSHYNKRLVGCPGGEGEDEHDVCWFWLEKGKPHECSVCTQYFMLDVIGNGGDPEGHSDNELEH